MLYTDLQLINGDPRVGRESLQHGHQKLETARPVSDEQHHANEVEDAHEDAGHVEKLQSRPRASPYFSHTLLHCCIHGNNTRIIVQNSSVSPHRRPSCWLGQLRLGQAGCQADGGQVRLGCYNDVQYARWPPFGLIVANESSVFYVCCVHLCWEVGVWPVWGLYRAMTSHAFYYQCIQAVQGNHNGQQTTIRIYIIYGMHNKKWGTERRATHLRNNNNNNQDNNSSRRRRARARSRKWKKWANVMRQFTMYMYMLYLFLFLININVEFISKKDSCTKNRKSNENRPAQWK